MFIRMSIHMLIQNVDSHMSTYTCLYRGASTRISAHMCMHLLTHTSIHLSIHMSTHMSAHMSAHMSIHMSIHINTCLYTPLPHTHTRAHVCAPWVWQGAMVKSKGKSLVRGVDSLFTLSFNVKTRFPMSDVTYESIVLHPCHSVTHVVHALACLKTEFFYFRNSLSPHMD